MSLLAQAVKKANEVDEIYYDVYLKWMDARGGVALGLPGNRQLTTLKDVLDHIQDRHRKIEKMTVEINQIRAQDNNDKAKALYQEIDDLTEACAALAATVNDDQPVVSN